MSDTLGSTKTDTERTYFCATIWTDLRLLEKLSYNFLDAQRAGWMLELFLRELRSMKP